MIWHEVRRRKQKKIETQPERPTKFHQTKPFFDSFAEIAAHPSSREKSVFYKKRFRINRYADLAPFFPTCAQQILCWRDLRLLLLLLFSTNLIKIIPYALM